jgi:diguanylate cyclase (GGDEF)-like protein/PAS domain S-box-containing protein
MEKDLGVHELLRSIEFARPDSSQDRLSDIFDGLPNQHPKAPGPSGIEDLQPDSRPSESIFSQLLERIVQGYSIRLETGPEEEASLEILLDGVSDSVLIVSTSGAIIDANQSFFRTFGYSRGQLLGTPIFSLLPESYRPAFREKLVAFTESAMEPRPASQDDILAFRGLRKDGTVLSMDCLLSGIRLGDDPAVLALIRDLSFDHVLFEQLKESKDHYVALSETITEAIFRLDEDFTIIFANSGVKNTFGFEREEVIGSPFSVLFPPEVYAKHEAEFRKYFIVDDEDRLGLGLKRTMEFLGSTKHRGVAPMEMSFGNSKDYKGRTLTCVIRDITQRKTLERKLRHLAYHDKLTGLGNRDLFNEDLAAVLHDMEKDSSRKAGLLFLDLDGFKHINDTLGHDAGDELLVETARRIRVCLRDHDSAYRFGGDEFVVVLAGMREEKDAVLVAKRILASIASPFLLKTGSTTGGSKVGVGVSIGIALMPDHGSSIEEATKAADISMYCSKEAGKNRYTLYDPELSSRATERWKLEQEMKAALGSGGFRLLYQPIISANGEVKGMEALLRWRRGPGDDVPPSTFVPVAEENGLIVAIGDLVLRRACYDAQRLHALGYPDIYVSVNVSSRQFDRPGFTDGLVDIVTRSGISPSTLKLELTESAIMKDTKDTIEKIKEIKRKLPGISVMVDDFGTGYSSLSYLSRLPVDALKIDISFVMNLAEEQNEKVVNAIINLGHSLDLDIVAEGIETREQWDYFSQRECGYMQGFFFLRPAPIEEVAALIDRGSLVHGSPRGGEAAGKDAAGKAAAAGATPGEALG